jgi:glutamate formiminotransferase
MGADLFESVPNFSEGRDAGVIDAIAQAVSGAHLLDVHPDPDHHRTVISVAGAGERLLPALVRAVAAAAERVDLTQHAGIHPRVGAADVVPIVPLGSTSLDTCHEVARQLGERIWKELKLPVFFYGHGEDWTLADIRAGRAQPDLGGPNLHPTFGAVCVGARRMLIAFNVMLEGLGVPEARALARSIRESSGGMRGVMALVFELPGGRIQLSMNLFRIDETSPQDVVDELRPRRWPHDCSVRRPSSRTSTAGRPASWRVVSGVRHLGWSLRPRACSTPSSRRWRRSPRGASAMRSTPPRSRPSRRGSRPSTGGCFSCSSCPW